MAQQKSAIMRLMPVAVFVLIAAVLGYGLQVGDPSKLPSTLIGKPVPQSEFPALEGLVDDANAPVPGFTGASLVKDKPTVVNFWASWCAQCIEEHPLINRLASDQDIDVYGVNYKDANDAARRYLGRHGNPYAAVGTDATGRNAIDWGVYGMPETFVVNGKGEIVYKHVGPISDASLAEKILPAIAAAKAVTPAAAKSP